MNETLIDLMRHGEPLGGSKYRGQLDDPLSEKGWAQMREKLGGHAPWQQVISSPLSRCREFAEELAVDHGLPLHVDERLKEVCFGVWEGKTAAQLNEENPQQLPRFRADPVNARPAGAEPLEQFYRRVVAALDEIVARHRHEHLLIICHAGVMRMALTHVLDVPLNRAYRIEVGHAALSRLAFDADASPRLVFHDGRLK
ncbi:MAG TPA: alpha-ribazole phosphatase family protein [Thiobacillaceae bacterium]|nr:alpha-ribazole phosphatase family protein [Thiobacillaceae bacterium]